MINRRGNTRIEWYDVDVLLWGSIVPPEAGTGPRYWDVWGEGPRGQKQQPYLDIGASGLYARKFWGTQLYMQENYTSGTTSGLHGGFCTQVSGLYPVSGFNLATKGYVDDALSAFTGGSTSLSGLIDVFDGPWSSGLFVSWNGTEFVPAFASATGGTGTGTGHYSIVFTATDSYQVDHNLSFYPQTTLLDSDGVQIETQVTHLSTSGLMLDFFGTITSGRVICDTTSGVGGTSSSGSWEISGTSEALGLSLPALYAASGIFLTQAQGNVLYQLSGTGSASSGSWEISGTSQTLNAGLPARFQASGSYQPAGAYITSSGSWEISGTSLALGSSLPALYAASGTYITQAQGDIRYALSGTGTVNSGSWEISGTSAALALTLPALYQASGLYELSGISYTKAESDVRYTLSGTGAGTGDITGTGISGQLAIFDAAKNLVSIDGDVRYALSGTGGGGSSTFAALTDVSGTWASGNLVGYNGTKYVAAAAGAAVTATSGQVEVGVLHQTLTGDGSISGLVFTSIPAGYDRFEIRAVMRSLNATAEPLYAHCNYDWTVTNYFTNGFNSQDNAVGAYQGNTPYVVNLQDTSEAAGERMNLTVSCHGYDQSAYKYYKTEAYQLNDGATELTRIQFIRWTNTAAITSFALSTASALTTTTTAQMWLYKNTWVVTSVSGGGTGPQGPTGATGPSSGDSDQYIIPISLFT